MRPRRREADGGASGAAIANVLAAHVGGFGANGGPTTQQIWSSVTNVRRSQDLAARKALGIPFVTGRAVSERQISPARRARAGGIACARRLTDSGPCRRIGIGGRTDLASERVQIRVPSLDSAAATGVHQADPRPGADKRHQHRGPHDHGLEEDSRHRPNATGLGYRKL